MKYIYIILFMFSISCTSVVSQQPSEEMEREKEFDRLLKQAKEAQTQNQLLIQSADEKTKEKVEKAAEKIVELKEQVVELKTEINEVNKKLDSVSDTVGVIKFNLRPISNGEKDW